jgi:hypothetical protein
LVKETRGKRRGRPPLRPGTTKRSAFNTRLTDELKEKLEAAAHWRGRSLSEEIELRLGESIADDGRFGGASTRLFGSFLVAVIADEERKTGKSWLTDRVTYRRALAAVSAIIGRMGPEPEKEAWKLMDRRAYGVACARSLLKFAGYDEAAIDKAINTLTEPTQ